MAIDKSKWNVKNKVSQSMIDDIKKQGMSAALKQAATSNNSKYVEGVRRLYTDERLNAARRAAGSRASNPDAPKGSKSAPVPGGSRPSMGVRSSTSSRPSNTLARPSTFSTRPGGAPRVNTMKPSTDSRSADIRKAIQANNKRIGPVTKVTPGSKPKPSNVISIPTAYGRMNVTRQQAQAKGAKQGKAIDTVMALSSVIPAKALVGVGVQVARGVRTARAADATIQAAKASRVAKGAAKVAEKKAVVREAEKTRRTAANAAIKDSIKRDLAAKTPAKAPTTPKAQQKPVTQPAKPTKVKPIKPDLTNKQKARRIGMVGATGYLANEYINRKK
jgi:hypothetical protein